MVVLSLTDPTGRLPAWEPGAHISLSLSNGLVRQYSLCGDPGDTTTWKIGVLRQPDGRGGSQYVHEALVPGTRVTAHGPSNHFALVEAQDYLFIAGGIGITPLLPMIAAAHRAGANWQLHYGGRNRSSMAFADQLTQQHGSNVQLYPQDELGLLDIPQLLGTAQRNTQIYCCGPEAMLDAIAEHHARLGVGTVHLERFTPLAGQAGDADGTAFDVICAASNQTLRIPPDQSILQVAQAAGIDVFYSCEEGICGTCETKILAGQADHRDAILSVAEQERNETMMICVSRSRDRCTLRLDL
ncbi:PDR/VanB family oxidoreductase [Nocardia sp. NPDC058705]|uniref:PDR/VanB family oxidoreductase n=1 Tax=Nocardia sp. NPDC058705 TaxID=3346609 RepID=UPI0036CA0576